MKLAEQYEKPEFITDDPVQFPRRFGYKCSQEIVGFIAAWLAYGNRKAILSTCEKLCKEMERLTPYMYIKNMGWRKYIDSEEPLYRFFKEKDFADLCRALKEIYDNNEDMEEALSKNYTRTMGATDYLDALISLFPGVKGIPQDSKSACKRLNMFLRWMCRRNSPVDLGIWSFIPQSSLLIPLDTHVATVGRQLGLITGKGDSMNTVLELTTNCRNVYPLDPCKCDYALFGYGVNNKNQERIMKKLLRKLFLYLFKEDFQRMKALERDLKGLIHRQKCATSLAEVRAERIRKLLGNIDVSVDVHQRSGNWAVVSLQGGKTDYIKFVDLDQRSIREISAFLRQFDRQNVKIDANPFDRQMLNEEIYRI